VPNQTSKYRRESLSVPCDGLYEAAHDDPNYTPSYDQSGQAPVFLFTEFMRFLRPPIPVQEFAGATAQSISNGRRVLIAWAALFVIHPHYGQEMSPIFPP